MALNFIKDVSSCVCVCVCVCVRACVRVCVCLYTNIYLTVAFICFSVIFLNYLFNPVPVNNGLCFFAFPDPPERPENLSCVALQVDKRISNNVTCSWDTRKRGTLIETKTSLFFSSG